MTVAIPVSMKQGLFRVEPFVILVGSGKTAFICIGRKRYERIVAPQRQATYLDRLAGTMHAFAEFAASLADKPLEEVLAGYPGSFVVDNDEIRSFRLCVDKGAAWEGRGSMFICEVQLKSGKYRCEVDRGFSAEAVLPELKEIFGDRLS